MGHAQGREPLLPLTQRGQRPRVLARQHRRGIGLLRRPAVLRRDGMVEVARPQAPIEAMHSWNTMRTSPDGSRRVT